MDANSIKNWFLKFWPFVTKKKYNRMSRAYSEYVGYCEKKDDEIDRLKKYLALEVFPKWDGCFIVRDPIIRVSCETEKRGLTQCEIPLDRYGLDVHFEMSCFGNPKHLENAVQDKMSSMVNYIYGEWMIRMNGNKDGR